MSFKKIESFLIETLQRNGVENPTPFQKNLLSKIRGGANIYAIAPESSGKTTAMIISIINKLKKASIDDAPRAIVLVESKEEALILEAKFKKMLYPSDLLMAVIYEEQKIDVQRDELYEGVDIVITTPKRLSKLYFLNGINLNKLELFFVDEASLLFKNANHADIIRLSESIKKCQYVLIANDYDNRFDQFQESFMIAPQVIKGNQ